MEEFTNTPPAGKERLNELFVELMEFMVEVSKNNLSFETFDLHKKFDLKHFKSLIEEFHTRVELAHLIKAHNRLQKTKTPDIFSFLQKKASIPLQNRRIKLLKKKLESEKKYSSESLAIKIKNTFDTDSIDGSLDQEGEPKFISHLHYNSKNYTPGIKKETDKNFLELTTKVRSLLDYSKDKNVDRQHFEDVLSEIIKLVSKRNMKLNLGVNEKGFTEAKNQNHEEIIYRWYPRKTRFDRTLNKVYEPKKV